MSMNLKTEPDWAWLKGKTVIITGAGSGLGRAMARDWASKGAYIVVGDMNEQAGKKVLEELREISQDKKSHCFTKTDVTSWDSQVSLFKVAAERSPGKHIDVVVANAGIGESDANVFFPDGNPNQMLKQPNMKTIDIDLTALVYTAHLAYHYFSLPLPTSSFTPRPHSLLLIGSMASLKYSSEPLYAAAKHGVLGLFRTLRRPHFFTKADRNNPTDLAQPIKIRPNLLCPFFVDTNIIKDDNGNKILPDEVELTKIEEVVEAAGRLILDQDGGKAMAVMTETMAKVASRGRNKGGILEIDRLEGRL